MSEILCTTIGAVAIGRNEGERLRRCLQSMIGKVAAVVYVDSGSSDGSVELARSMGADVIELDRAVPFTAARARNSGVARLRRIAPHIEFVHVVDGDCEIIDGWIEHALQYAQSATETAVVCGRRRERYPHASIYNRLCDMEWNTPIGEATSCGGDALIRIEAFAQVNGYDDSVIAGEEPELCMRLRRAGWKIQRLEHDMTLHDAQLTRFAQWWKRMVRSGHAYAQGRAMHGQHGHCVREVRSIIEWALLLPLLALGLAWVTWGFSLLLFGGYAYLAHRVRRHRIEHGDSPEDASLYAGYCVLGKFAQLIGIGQYWWSRVRGRPTAIIEYKALPKATNRREPEVSRT